MRYRIKIITFKNGRQVFSCYFRRYFLWINLNQQGKEDSLMSRLMLNIDSEFNSREEVLKVIDKHFEGNSTVQEIEFEYINK